MASRKTRRRRGAGVGLAVALAALLFGTGVALGMRDEEDGKDGGKPPGKLKVSASGEFFRFVGDDRVLTVEQVCSEIVESGAGEVIIEDQDGQAAAVQQLLGCLAEASIKASLVG